MLKRLTQWTQHGDLTREDALRYWQEEHAPLVLRVPGLLRYVQNECVDGPDGSTPPYTGLGEAWFTDVESARAALASGEWKAVLADAARFMDLDAVSAAWTKTSRSRSTRVVGSAR